MSVLRSLVNLNLALATSLGQAGDAKTAAQDEQALRAVVEQFRTGLLERNAEKIRAVFLDGTMPLVGVSLKDGRFQANPSTADGLIKAVLDTPTKKEEKFSDFEFRIDEGVAVLTTQYSFHVDGKMTNQGLDIWSLVRTEAGWKVVSLVWSRKPPAPAPANGLRP